MKSKITKILIELEGRDPISLSMEEAKDLYETLSELFKKDMIRIPYYPPPEPIIPNKKYPYPSEPWTSKGTDVQITYFTSDQTYPYDSESPL